MLIGGVLVIGLVIFSIIGMIRHYVRSYLKIPSEDVPMTTPAPTPAPTDVVIGEGVYSSIMSPDRFASPFKITEGLVYFYDDIGQIKSLLVAHFLVEYQLRNPTKISTL